MLHFYAGLGFIGPGTHTQRSVTRKNEKTKKKIFLIFFEKIIFFSPKHRTNNHQTQQNVLKEA